MRNQHSDEERSIFKPFHHGRCVLPALAIAAFLAGCGEERREARPLFYASLEAASAEVDAPTAASLISGYRRNNGLGPVMVDADLQRRAAEAARAMAAADRPSSADSVKARLKAGGVTDPAVNLSAGYRTLAEAFSGWRDQPQNNRVMLDASATRLGIATAYAPQSKYKVYWALILAR
jgi:uncharacterized protein YkwD